MEGVGSRFNFDRALERNLREFDVEELKDKNREVMLLLLDKVQATRDSKYIRLLEAWAMIDYKKVKRRIGQVIRELDRPAA